MPTPIKCIYRSKKILRYITIVFCFVLKEKVVLMKCAWYMIWTYMCLMIHVFDDTCLWWYCLLTAGRPVIPSIPKIQRLIETAWQKGFDQQGCDQLGGKVVDTTKWIGATEILATLSSLRIKYIICLWLDSYFVLWTYIFTNYKISKKICFLLEYME